MRERGERDGERERGRKREREGERGERGEGGEGERRGREREKRGRYICILYTRMRGRDIVFCERMREWELKRARARAREFESAKVCK